MRYHELISGAAAPRTISFKVLYHVGSMNAADKRKDSYEGAGLSVSLHPDEWRHIAKGFVSGDTWELRRPGNKFLNYHQLTKAQKQAIAAWGIEQGLAVPSMEYKVWTTDENGEWRYFVVQSREEAESEVEDFEDNEEPYRIEEVPHGLAGTEKLAQLSHQSKIDPGGALELIVILYADQVLGLDGVWWQDTFDPAALSAPRGVIFADRLKAWTITKVNTIEENQELPAPPQPLPPNVLHAFLALGEAQRDIPERAMLRVQFAMGGGVLSPCVEHVGDLTHRMTHMLKYGPDKDGRDLVYDKCRRCLNLLTSGYGFDREFHENIRANAQARGQSVAQFEAVLDKALRAYAEAHDHLTVYNHAQWLARDAAVRLGYRSWVLATQRLRELMQLAEHPEAYAAAALAYRLDGDGNPVPYTGP